jgi:type II secretory ATPase GspE/PulE/Tfp pilus assembly ATPase PilB-like protein
MNNELRELAFRGSTLSDLRQAAMASGMRNLLSDGRLKILHGITTAEEVLANAQAGELVLE